MVGLKTLVVVFPLILVSRILIRPSGEDVPAGFSENSAGASSYRAFWTRAVMFCLVGSRNGSPCQDWNSAGMPLRYEMFFSHAAQELPVNGLLVKNASSTLMFQLVFKALISSRSAASLAWICSKAC